MHPFNFCEHSTVRGLSVGKLLSHIASFAALLARVRWGCSWCLLEDFLYCLPDLLLLKPLFTPHTRRM